MLLGEILIQDGVLTPAQVEEALEAQVLHGGRIGTNLVELGHLTEEQLARGLGRQHRVHFAHGEIVPSAEALALVEAQFADDKDVLPVRLDGNRLYLLVLDPDDIEAADTVAALTGKRVVPVVVAEFRMAQLQRRYYKAFRPVRDVDLEAVRRKRAEALAAQQAPPAADLMSEDEFDSLYAAAMTGRALPPAAGQPVEEPLEEALIVEEIPEAELLPLEPEPVAAAAAAAGVQAGLPVPAAPGVPAAPVPPVVAASPGSAAGLPPPQAAAPAPPQVCPAPPPPASAPLPPQPAPQAAAAPKPGPPVAEETAGPAWPQVERRVAPEAPHLPERRRRLRRQPRPEDNLPVGFDEAQKALQSITDREDIARIVLRFAAGKFRRALLLNVQRDFAVGWLGAGAALKPEVARFVAISLKKPSAFKLVRDSRSHYLGPLRRDLPTVMFLRSLGEGEPRSALLMPVLAAGRVVNILYADHGPGELTPPDVGELLILAQKVGRSYEAMIAARRAAAAAGPT